MIRIYKHTVGALGRDYRGSAIVPGNAKRLVGVAVCAVNGLSNGCTFLINRLTDSSSGFRIRLNVNNKQDNILDLHYSGGYIKDIDNADDDQEVLIPMNYSLNKQSKIDYIIDVPNTVTNGNSLKVYLKFE